MPYSPTASQVGLAVLSAGDAGTVLEEFFAAHYLGGAESRRLYVAAGAQLLGSCWEAPSVAAMPPALSLRLSSSLMQLVRV